MVLLEMLESRTLLAAATFEFTLPHTDVTSAGVFKPDGTLVRTLWSGVSYDAGTYNRSWDGLDDWGNRLADGAYDIRVLTNNVSYTWEGVVGNTSTSQTDSTVWKSYDNIGALAIAGGAAFYGNGYPEAGSTSGRFSLAAPNSSKTLIGGKGGDTWNVATDGTNVYWSGQDSANSNTYVYATRVSNDAQVVFASGAPYTPTYGITLSSVIDKRTDGYSITGLAVQPTGSYLFVSHAASNILDVVNKTTGAIAQTITSFTAPGSMAVDGGNNLWIEVLSGTTPQVQQYSVQGDGTLTYLRSASGSFSSPLAMAVSPDNSTVVVVDGGASQQLKAFSIASGTSSWTFGQSGGYISSPEVANDKFMFEGAGAQGDRPFSGIAFESDGSFWVTDIGNDRVQHFAANRTYIDQIQYLSASYNTSIDQNNPTRLFSDYLEFSIDYTKPLDPSNGSWTLKRNWGKAMPAGFSGSSYRKLYPQTLSNGRTYALIPRDSDSIPKLFELTAAGTIRDTGILTTSATASLQPDGSLRTVNAPATGGTLAWNKSTLIGFNASNNPIYSASAVLATAPAAATDPVWRGDVNHIRAGIQTTGDVLISFNHAFSGATDKGYHLGAVRLGGTDWLWRTSMATHTSYMGDYPMDGSFDIGNSLWNAGSMAVTLDHNVFWGYYGEHYKTAQTNMFAHYNDDGLFVSNFGVVGADVGGNAGSATPAAGMAGNALNPWVIRAPDGNVYLYHNDESWHSGVHRWRIDGLDSIAEQTFSINFTAGATAGLRGEYFDSSDLSNLQSKTIRSDGTVNFNWGTGIPAGIALTAADSYSVRWEGFVNPLYSQTYTFYTNGDSGARLWVNGTLVVNKWTTPGEQSGTIALKAGTPYKIRMEYKHATGSASASLSWSSTSQAKQIVPQSRLAWMDWQYPAPTTTVNLLDGLKFDTTVENGMYGWTRNGATDAGGWTVRTSKYSYSKTAPDINISYSNITNGPSTSVARKLGSPSDSTQAWTLSGNLNYSGNYPNHSATSGQYLEVLDDGGRVIARFYPYQYTYPSDYRLFANNQTLVSLARSQFDTLTTKWQPFQISGAGGMITFSYAGYQVTTGVFDAASNWRRATTLQCRFLTGSQPYYREIGLENLGFVASAAVPAPAAPSGLSAAAATSSQIDLTWTDNSSNETGFRIERATDSGFTTGLTTLTVGANVTTFSSTGLALNTTYYFRVLALGSQVNSGYAPAVQALLRLGDANLDGQVDLTDLTILAGNWQLSGKNFASGDFNDDGTVDLTDLTILAGYWQTPTPAALSPAIAITAASNSAAISADEDNRLPTITADESSSSVPEPVDQDNVESSTAATPPLPEVADANGAAPSGEIKDEVISGGAGNDIVLPEAADATYEKADADPMVEARTEEHATASDDRNNTLLGQASDDVIYDQTNDVIPDRALLAEFRHARHHGAGTWRNSLHSVLVNERDLLGAKMLKV